MKGIIPWCRIPAILLIKAGQYYQEEKFILCLFCRRIISAQQDTEAIIKKAKIMFLCYPNNPTGAVADSDFYKEAVRFAVKNNIIIVSDLAYSEMSYDGYKPFSMLEIKGAKDVVIEFHSLSKTYNMTGWRIVGLR